jgi:hypothetical protein
MNAKLLIRCEAELLLQPCSTTMIQTKKMPARAARTNFQKHFSSCELSIHLDSGMVTELVQRRRSLVRRACFSYSQAIVQ